MSAYRMDIGTLSAGIGVIDEPGDGTHVLYALPSARDGDKGPVRPMFAESSDGVVFMRELVEDSAGILA
jgi:hypothetical protein